MSVRYVVKPRGLLDLDVHARYLLERASLEIALRFLDNAHETFALLASQPNMGWRSRTKHPGLEELRVFRIDRFEKMLVLYRPIPARIEILRVIDGSHKLRSLLRREGLE